VSRKVRKHGPFILLGNLALDFDPAAELRAVQRSRWPKLSPCFDRCDVASHQPSCIEEVKR